VAEKRGRVLWRRFAGYFLQELVEQFDVQRLDDVVPVACGDAPGPIGCRPIAANCNREDRLRESRTP
jgi:hypothetical protein